MKPVYTFTANDGDFSSNMEKVFLKYLEQPDVREGRSTDIRSTAPSKWDSAEKYEFAFRGHGGIIVPLAMGQKVKENTVVDKTTFLSGLSIGLCHHLADAKYLEAILEQFVKVFGEEPILYLLNDNCTKGVVYTDTWLCGFFAHKPDGETLD